MNIEEFISKKFPKSLVLENISLEEKNDADFYYTNSKADAIYGFESIKKNLNKKHKILEIGGGLHFLSNYLSFLGHSVTSIEPGGFGSYIDIMRKKTLEISKDKFEIITSDLENFSEKNPNNLFDFIFSINVLEHVKDIKIHLKKSISLLKDKDSRMYVRCPNYLFPFEPHFYKFFIPFFPNFTFKKLYKKKLIHNLGEKRYYNLIDHLNLDCNYLNIKKNNIPFKLHNPSESIFERIEKDEVFKSRLFSNKLIKYIYKFLIFFRIKKLVIIFFPIFLNPYLIMEFKKDKE